MIMQDNNDDTNCTAVNTRHQRAPKTSLLTKCDGTNVYKCDSQLLGSKMFTYYFDLMCSKLMFAATKKI